MTKLQDLGLLGTRVAFGGMMAMGHGWGKFSKLLSGEELQFADPIGMGESLSFVLAASAELLCAAFVALGLLTRLNLIPLAFTMFVAVFVIHGNDPFANKELALLYLSAWVGLFLTGPGRYTLQNLVGGRLNSDNPAIRFLTR